MVSFSQKKTFHINQADKQIRRYRNCIQNVCVAVKVLKHTHLHTLDKEQVILYVTTLTVMALKVS